MNATKVSEGLAPLPPFSPRVLVLDEELPWPPHTGKRLRTLNLLTELARDFPIDLLVHGLDVSSDAVTEMVRRGVTVHLSRSRIPEKRGVLLPLRIAASLAKRLPYSVHSHYQREYARSVTRLLGERRHAMVHCEWTPYAVYARSLHVPVSVAAHNVEYWIWQRMAESAPNSGLRAFYRVQASLMQRFERETYRRFDNATAVSDPDAEVIRQLGCRNVVVVPNGVDTDAYRPAASAAEEAGSIVFTGSLDWRPNQDAIRWFIQEVHPILQSRVRYHFYVVGRTPPAWLRDPAIVPKEITVTGTVDDVRPWIARAPVYVVPLLAGGGSRLKILEALAMGKALVSTTVGAEGLDLEPLRHLLIADDARSFAEAIYSLLKDAPRRQSLGRAGREQVQSLYRWDRIAPRQAALWRGLIGGARDLAQAEASALLVGDDQQTRALPR